MAAADEDLPEGIEALKAALIAERAKRIDEAARAARVEAELAVAKAKASDDAAVIAHQRLQIQKLSRELYGHRSERTVRLLDQIELTFEELESSASEDEIAAERAVAKTTNVVAFTRKRPARQPFPEHLPRERVVEPGLAACQCCGSSRLRKPTRAGTQSPPCRALRPPSANPGTANRYRMVAANGRSQRCAGPLPAPAARARSRFGRAPCAGHWRRHRPGRRMAGERVPSTPPR